MDLTVALIAVTKVGLLVAALLVNTALIVLVGYGLFSFVERCLSKRKDQSK